MIAKSKKKVLVTGCAGFIGRAVCLKLLESNYQVIGIDNLNNYYSVKLKKKRLDTIFKFAKNNKKFFKFIKIDIKNYSKLDKLFKINKFYYVINLAAQAGVQYSLINPKSYIQTNIVGFFNILELSKTYKVKHLISASTSSVYGSNTLLPFKEKHFTDNQIQMYAATKKSNELMARSYSHLYKLPITILRFFTVYGPWGRPDMSLFNFVDNITRNKEIYLNNFGNHSRSFTYIDDVVNVVVKLIKVIPNNNFSSYTPPFEIYNVGNNKNISLISFVKLIEKHLKIKARIKYRTLQVGDIIKTKADITKIKKIIKNFPKTSVNHGVKKFISWYKEYKNIT